MAPTGGLTTRRPLGRGHEGSEILPPHPPGFHNHNLRLILVAIHEARGRFKRLAGLVLTIAVIQLAHIARRPTGANNEEEAV